MAEETKGYPKGEPVAPGTAGEPERVEKRVKVKLAERQFFAGRWHEAGETVEVYERERDALVARGAVEGDRREAERALGSSLSGARSRPRRGRRPAER